ncbi:hypothetical protein LOM8899_00105 [Flavimaricola marinus]|uniref:Uncharacterized protein n=1 Tax=Flavimaricola marinus TaxID=1819565 RepID=A0A238L998_9RHOB|nr:hypothetical protein LOM8899_00105 [Flavimaricola marinus]
MKRLLSLLGNSATYIAGYALGSAGLLWGVAVGWIGQSWWGLLGAPLFLAGVGPCLWSEDQP